MRAQAYQRHEEGHGASDPRGLAPAIKALAAPVKAGARPVPTLENW